MAGGKQDGAAGKKADAKPAANKKASQNKKTQPQDDKQDFSDLRDAIDGKLCSPSRRPGYISFFEDLL